MNELWRFLTFASSLVFVAALLYSQYALLRIEIDRRRRLGWGWMGFRFPWSTRELSAEGLRYRARLGRALLVTLAAAGVAAVAIAAGP